MRRRAAFVAVAGGAAPGALIAIITGAIAGWLVGVVVLGAVTILGAMAVWDRSTATALRLVGARPCRRTDQPRLFNVTEGLCATFGLRLPGLWVVDDPVPNSCALGRSAHDAVIVVTTGLLDQLALIELEGLIAHELAHVKRHDTVLAGVAVVVLAPYARLTGHDGLLAAVVGSGREYQADRLAVSTVRYPPGLCDALRAMATGPGPSAGSVFARPRWAMTRWIWADPDPHSREAGVAASAERGGAAAAMDDLEVRIAALAER